MDYKQQAVRTIKSLNLYRNNKEKIHDLIIEVCKLFDIAEKTELQTADYSFLYYISSEIGIPQYYELLCNKKKIEKNEFSLSDLLAIIQNSSLVVDENMMLHRYQKQVYDNFNNKSVNRFFLSAPTSFGKTFIVYEIIKKMKYENIVLIFPTIALLGENYLHLLELKQNDNFWREYNIHTLSDEPIEQGKKHLWIYTPERFMSYIDKHSNNKFDFVFIDEIYKIDNQYIVDVETIGENERDLSFRVALFETCLQSKDILLAGPYISFPNNGQNQSLNYFLNDNKFKVLDFNKIEIVDKLTLSVGEKREYEIDNLNFKITNKKSEQKLLTILNAVLKNNQDNGTIVYCGKKAKTESLAKFLIKNLKVSKLTDEDLSVFIQHLSRYFDSEWIVIKALEYGIGIHHGLIPKYIQREIISLFNRGIISILLSTTTITEGINTIAKNVIVMSNKKGTKDLKHFDAQNIAGRAGRFNSHYIGRVFSIDNSFLQTLSDDGDCLTHKSYDSLSEKTDVDLDICENTYLSSKDLQRKQVIERDIAQSGIPIDIINQFKTISKVDKLNLYNKIQNLPNNDLKLISLLCREIAMRRINWNGFDLFCKVVLPFVSENNLKELIERKTNRGYCVLTAKVHYYLVGGFTGVINYEKESKSIDTAIRDSSKLVFNVFRYQLTKYLGVFDLLYRYYLSKKDNKPIEEIKGLNVLIQLLEYGSINDKAKKANDYGVPYAIVSYYEKENQELLKQFDEYEKKIFNKINKILN